MEEEHSRTPARKTRHRIEDAILSWSCNQNELSPVLGRVSEDVDVAMKYVMITDTAIEAFRNKLEKRGTIHARVRLGVLGSGCNGYSYSVSFEDNDPRPTDLQYFYFGIRVVIDKKSIVILDGCSLDYKSSLKESGFAFSNPKAKSVCGCGESFST